uniref:Solute carrier family 17 member 9 n=1 Tax=Chrysolophus pictus TaxID=9089 RepID=A0A8C3M1C0_CHRPC
MHQRTLHRHNAHQTEGVPQPSHRAARETYGYVNGHVDQCGGRGHIDQCGFYSPLDSEDHFYTTIIFVTEVAFVTGSVTVVKKSKAAAWNSLHRGEFALKNWQSWEEGLSFDRGPLIGGEKVLLLSASAWGFLTFITPLLTQITSAHLVFMTCSRFLMGLLQGVYFPSLASLLSQRVRESERAFTYTAGSLLLDWYGWESVFYFSGLLTLLWVYCTCKYLLTEKDLVIPIDYLMRSISVSKQSKVPWKQLFKKAPIWAVIIAQLCTASTFFTLLSWLPTFFKESFPQSKGWVFNVVPWLVAIPTSLFSGFLSDHLINQENSLRYLIFLFFQVIGSGVSSMFALCLGQTSSFCNAIVFASASVGLQTFNHSGISVNVQDLAPSCAGLLFGVGNTGGALLGVVCVYLAGYLMETTGSWISVFNLVAAVNSVGLCAFLVFGEAQRVDTDSAYIDM